MRQLSIFCIFIMTALVAFLVACTSGNMLIQSFDGSSQNYRYYVYVEGGSAIQAFQLDPSNGSLTHIADYSLSLSMISMAMDVSGLYLYAANNSNGNVQVFNVSQTDGSLSSWNNYGISSGLQAVAVDPSGHFLYAADNSSGAIYGFTLSAGSLTAISGSPWTGGAGPTAIAVDPAGTYLMAALGTAGMISEFTFNGTTGIVSGGGSWTVCSQPQDVKFNPTGNLVFAACGTTSGLVAIMPFSGGSLGTANTYPTGSSGTSATVDPTGTFLYVTDSAGSGIYIFKIDQATGTLTSNGLFNPTSIQHPMYAAIDPSGNFLIVPNQGNNTISVLQIDKSLGTLTEVPSSPLPAVASPSVVVVTRQP